VTSVVEVITHIIPARVVARMVCRIEAGLRKEGLDPTGVELDRLAGEFVRRDFVAELGDRGAHVSGSSWELHADGLELRVELGAADLMIFRAVSTETDWS
jgi:hypothetical protein